MDRRIFLLACLLVLFVSSAAFGTPEKTAPKGGKNWVEGEVIVTWKAGNDGSARSALSAGAAVQTFSALSEAADRRVEHLRVPGKTTEELLRELSADSRVESVSPNYIIRAFAVPNDPFFSRQWGLSNTGQTGGAPDADIDAPEGWDARRQTLPGQVVAILDTGIAQTHEDLAANLWTGPGGIHGYDVINGDNDPEDDEGHGTHVAGIIGAAGNNGRGVTGVAWKTSLMAVKMLDSTGTGTTAQELAAYNWVLQKKKEGVNIVAVNASYGGGGSSQAAKDALAALGERGILFVAAAGNDGENNDTAPQYPASYSLPNILSVAATDEDDQLASFSNYGASSVHLAAPGTDIFSTMTGYSPGPSDLFFDNMEGGAGNWTTSGTVNLWGIISTTRGGTATKAWSDSPNQHYPDNQRTWLSLNRDLDLSASGTAPLFFAMEVRLDLEDGYDFLHLEFSSDGGASWSRVHSFTGGGDEWSSFSLSIAPAFRTNRFRFRFAFESDSGNLIFSYAGVQIDNVGVGSAQSSYLSLSGTSMATPFVTGAVALVRAQYPDESAAAGRSRILNSTDRLSSLSGKVSSGGRLNLARALQATPDGGSDEGGGGGCSLGTSPLFLLLVVPLLFLRKKQRLQR